MKTYKYTSAENKAVHIIDEDGISRSSCMSSAVPEGAQIEAYVRTLDEIKELLTNVVQEKLDATARFHGYSGILSACSYAGAPNPFRAEGSKFVLWRGEVWEACYAIMNEVMSGTRGIPTETELLNLLPIYI